MNKIHKILINLAMLLVAVAMLPVQAQDSPPLLLTLSSPNGFGIIPVMEGWTANEDDTVSYSFGTINRNTEGAVDIPLGERNYIEPARFNGMQPTHFPPGHAVGVFSVTVPANMTDVDVWWHLISEDGEDLKVPGRSTTAPYELDFILPRPQGSLQPLAGFGENGDASAGLLARVEDYQGSVSVGNPVTLTVNVIDPSDRDVTDPRFEEPLDVGVTWYHHQGPGMVEFTRHASTPEPEEVDPDSARARFLARNQGPNRVAVGGPSGVANVIATFSEPGEYILRTRADSFAGSDSSEGDQCCWTNVFQRVTVSP